MGVFRIYPNKDNWITDAHPDGDTSIRASGSNHGRSPALNIFARKGDISSASIELARSLVRFDITELSGKIYTDLAIPSSSVTYKLRMFDMRHEDTVPTSYDLFVYPVSRSWDEGVGIDDDKHNDSGWANWLSASSTQTWDATGSDFYSTTNFGSASQRFDYGNEDLEVNVSDLVINWLTASIPNYGIVIKLGDSEEKNGTNYFVKKFHGRETKFVDRMPYIEARWSNDVIKDNRNNFAFDQDSNLYLYNLIRGDLTNLTAPVIVRIQDGITSSSFSSEVTASFVEVGIYSASFNVVNTSSFSASIWNDIWFSGSRVYMTGAFKPLVLTGSGIDQYDEFDLDVVNLKRKYSVSEEARVVVNVRKRDFATHTGLVSSASLDLEREYIDKMYYKVINDETGEDVIPYGTGSSPYTQLSYNGDGNFFNIWMQNFIPGFKYRLIFLIDINKFDKKTIDDDFTFKVI